MIVLSLAEKTISSLLKRARAHKKRGLLIEVRLDALTKYTVKDLEILEKEIKPLYTLRSKEEGGRKALTSSEREKKLKELIDLKPRFIDLEYVRDKKIIPYLKQVSPKTKWILSFHNTKKMPKDLGGLFNRMKAFRPWLVKIAGQSRSIVDTLIMLDLVKRNKQLVGIAMGDVGQLTRVLGPVMGQPLHYVSESKKIRVAPGSMSLEELEEQYRFSKLNTRTKLLGLIGYPITHSPGQKVYNAYFKKKRMNALYLNIEVPKKDFFKVLDLLNRIGFYGLSVTMPYKEMILKKVDHVHKSQKGISSVNTIKFHKNKLYALNTDGIGARTLLSKHTKLKGKKVLIIGAGGVSKGIAYELKKKGAHLVFCNRTQSKAKRLAREFGADDLPFDKLNALKETDYDLLINATSVGVKNKRESIVESKSLFSKKVVLDVAHKKTHLNDIAKRKRAISLQGDDFWVYQGVEQLYFWFKVRPHRLIYELKEELK